MAVKTWLDIHVEDGQLQKATLSLRVKDIAFAAAQSLPVAAKIDAVIDSIFAEADTPSNARVTGYAIRVEEDAPGSTGGGGESAISSTAKTRSALTAIPGNWLLSIPGLNKFAVTWGTVDRNGIVTVGGIWTAIRAAMSDAAIAVGDPQPELYAATPSAQLFQEASGFDGRRAAPRPR